MTIFAEILIGVKVALIVAAIFAVPCAIFLVMIAAQNKIDQLISRHYYKQLYGTLPHEHTLDELEQLTEKHNATIRALESGTSSLNVPKTPQHNIPVSSLPKSPKAFRKLIDLTDRVKSPAVLTELQSLNNQLEAYFGSETKNDTLSDRLSSYYLPTLEIVLTSLAEGEYSGTARTADRETLCLKAIDTVQNILATHHESAEDFKLMELTAEVETLSNIAAVNGDIKTSYHLHSIC